MVFKVLSWRENQRWFRAVYVSRFKVSEDYMADGQLLTFSSSESTLPTLTEHGKSDTKSSALPGRVVALVFLVLGVTVCASAWIYYEGSTLLETFRNSPELT